MNNIKITMRATGLAFILLVALPMLSIVEVMTLEGQQAYAQKTKKVQSIRQKHIKTFEKMQEAFDAGDIPGTLRQIDKLSKEEDLNNIEQAYIRNFRGNIYFQQDNLNAALAQFKGIVQNSEGVPDAFTNQMLYVIAQVLFSQEKYREALTYAQRWFKTLPAPTADGYLLIGQAQYQLKDYDGALKNVQSGIDLYTKDGRKPKESWLNLLSNIYRNKNQYAKMEPVLKQLVEYYPKKPYLTTLAGVFNERDKQLDMTAVFLGMYDQGLQTNESELVTVASLMLSNDNPYKAAKIMEKGIKDGIIKKNVKNYGLYSQSLFFAKEYDKAIGPLREAARLDSTGKYYDQLGQSLIALNQYPEAEKALQSAINKGGLQDTGQTLLSLGLTQFEQKKFNSAKGSFNKALKYQKTRKSAQNWIKYVDSEVQRLAALKEEIVINTDVEPEER
ncbi:MAG: tetratricopeptide repeat protein [Acidiferrobacterales bacterium]|nr:tetratricopeptide repeat protein [Acidiferrobacterales bacterium]